MKHRTAVIAGERIDLTWDETDNAVEATINGRAYKLEARRVARGVLWFGFNGASVEARVTQEEQGYSVSIRESRIQVEFLDSTKKARRHGATSDGIVEVRAPMPGKIVRILRSPGDAVSAQQGVAVMEAMKMQNEIRSPKEGKILKINVAEGDAVNLGDLIAEVE